MHKYIVAALATAALCLVPVTALAVSPAKNSSFSWCEKKNVCAFSFDTNKRGTKLVNMRLYTKCLPVPLMRGWPTIGVKKGKFSKQGTAVDVLGNAVSFKLTGKFVSKRKAVGTFDVDRKDCSDRARKFTAKRRGRAA